jgi:hypothetical protein
MDIKASLQKKAPEVAKRTAQILEREVEKKKTPWRHLNFAAMMEKI